MKKQLELSDYLDGFHKKDRSILARAITLVESQNPVHQQQAQELLTKLLPRTGSARRIGISGTPGVGKSTFIEAFGKHLTSQQKSVAVLAVDPTSQVSGGSILGDKTRMNELAVDPLAFIRPSPSGETLGGVASKTREALLLCEAFGFDWVLVETVGVGQSETAVAQMVDMFVMLLQPGAGDDLQGIKRGILELVDLVVVTKDDGDNRSAIARARHDYEMALQILRHEGEIPSVLSCSALTKHGLPEVLASIEAFFTQRSAQITQKRESQALDWMWDVIRDELQRRFERTLDPGELRAAEAAIRSKKASAPSMAQELLRKFFEDK
jgi:LAO/AO transport system kinase